MRASILLLTLLAVLLCATPSQAQQPGKRPLTVKVGVLSDMSGLYADIGGPGSVIAARMAVEDSIPPVTTSRSKSFPPIIKTSPTPGPKSPAGGTTSIM